MQFTVYGSVVRLAPDLELAAYRVVQQALDRYFVPDGKQPDRPYTIPQAHSVRPPKSLDQFTALSNFVEVFLAKENHSGLVGINLLENKETFCLTHQTRLNTFDLIFFNVVSFAYFFMEESFNFSHCHVF